MEQTVGWHWCPGVHGTRPTGLQFSPLKSAIVQIGLELNLLSHLVSRQFLPVKSKHFPCVLTKCNRVSPRLEVTNVPAVQVNLRHENASATITMCLYGILQNIRATYHTSIYIIILRRLFFSGSVWMIFMTKETCRRKILAFSRLPRFQHAEPITSPSCWLFSASQTINLAAQVGKMIIGWEGKSANIHHTYSKNGTINWCLEMNFEKTLPSDFTLQAFLKEETHFWIFWVANGWSLCGIHISISLKFGCSSWWHCSTHVQVWLCWVPSPNPFSGL